MARRLPGVRPAVAPGQRVLGPRRVVEHVRVHGHIRRQRLAQRPGGQQLAVADAAIVEHHHLHVARQCKVLQSVVGDQHVDLGMRGAQRARSVDAAPRHPHRRTRAPKDQQRLVAHRLDIVVLGDGRCAVTLAAVAARDHARHITRVPQCSHERDDGRRLARAPDNEVADHDYRHRRTLGLQPAHLIGQAARGGDGAITPRQGHQPKRGGRSLGTPPQPGQAGLDAVSPGHV